MKIVVNGQEKEYSENITLQDVICDLKIENKVMAAAVNMEIIKKDQWDKYKLNQDDKLELLQFVGGG
jgi:sulfur carrier protein